MKHGDTINQKDTFNTGVPGALLPLAALCCLVVALVGMGLKLPWFRRQMRLGNRAHGTAEASSQRELTASITNMPSQGIFRRLSFEDFPMVPPPPPPRKEMTRQQSTPVLEQPSVTQKTKERPVSQPPAVKTKSKPIVVAPPPIKTKVAPPTRRNPNAMAFTTMSEASKSVNKPHKINGPPSPVEASNPMMQGANKNTDNGYNDLVSPANGLAIVPVSRSPKPAVKKGPKKDPKAHKKRNMKDKKTPVFAKMSPKVVESPSPPPIPRSPPPELPGIGRNRTSSGSEDEEGDGNFKFRLPDPPEPIHTHHSFLHMGVGDSDECEA